MKRQRGKTLHHEAREVIANVIKICDEEAANKAFKLPITSKTERAALYTGVGRSTIVRIRKENEERMRNDPQKPLSSPGKKRPRPSIIDKVDNFDFSIIRRTIEEFYLELKVVPTTDKLLTKLREKIDFPYGRDSLRLLLKANGFHWRKSQNKRKILMEKPNILHWRYKYIRDIRKFRAENKNIIYLDETWVDNDLTFKKCWQSESVFGVVSNISSTGMY